MAPLHRLVSMMGGQQSRDPTPANSSLRCGMPFSGADDPDDRGRGAPRQRNGDEGGDRRTRPGNHEGTQPKRQEIWRKPEIQKVDERRHQERHHA